MNFAGIKGSVTVMIGLREGTLHKSNKLVQSRIFIKINGARTILVENLDELDGVVKSQRVSTKSDSLQLSGRNRTTAVTVYTREPGLELLHLCLLNLIVVLCVPSIQVGLTGLSLVVP